MGRSAGVRLGARASIALGLLVVWATVGTVSARAVPPPEQDPFYTYAGLIPLAEIAPGVVLKTRILAYHITGIPVPIRAVQLLYRSTGELGQPTVNVTSVLEPPRTMGTPEVIAYQSFYDSLNRDDEPSYAIAGGLTLGGLIPTIESGLVVPDLLRGYAVVVADTEGQTADFAAGPEYGMNTLDSLRAALRSPATGLANASKIALVGYSGGAIATEWAAELAPSYAPDINRLLVGAAMGGVLVDPAHNLAYVDGSRFWAGVMPMAIIGISRAFEVDFTPYLSSEGVQLFNTLQHASIVQVLGSYPGLTWAELVKPQYQDPISVPVYVRVVNQLIMGSRGTPTVPLFIGQGADGELEGTIGDQPGIGEGDGVMVAGDVRSLAREYCRRGLAVQYDQFDHLAHIGSAVPWLVAATPWLADRFAGLPAPQDCSDVAPGNSLSPIR
ncbi:MAG: lipase family protein [Solirubrobacteraceae bacterium]